MDTCERCGREVPMEDITDNGCTHCIDDYQSVDFKIVEKFFLEAFTPLDIRR